MEFIRKFVLMEQSATSFSACTRSCQTTKLKKKKKAQSCDELYEKTLKTFQISEQPLLQWQVCHAKKKKKKKKKGKADLTIVLHIRELPHLHMKFAVWFSFPTTNNKNPMIPS